MTLGFDFTSGYATVIYVLGSLLVVVGVLERLYGWSRWLRHKLLTTIEGTRRLEHDRLALAKIRETLRRPLVTTFLREHDFGASWPAEWMDPIFALGRLNNVEDRFLDEQLEQLRVELQEAVNAFILLLEFETFPSSATAYRLAVILSSGRNAGNGGSD